jgi:hypothetical protein
LAVINSLEEPFLATRGHVLDVGSSSLWILCEATLAAGAWVRVESNGWILFGKIAGVLAISAAVWSVGVQFEAAFHAHSTAPVTANRFLRNCACEQAQTARKD